MQKLRASWILVIFFTFFLHQNCLGHGPQIIMNPHISPYTSIGQTIGGASVALADSIPDIYKNPANIAQLKHFKAFISLNYRRNYIEASSSDFVDIDKQWNDKFYINSFAISIPFRILSVPIIVAGSYNSNHPYYYEVGNSDVSDRFSAHLHMASLGLGLQPSSKLRLGLGWTRLLSRYQQISVEIPTDQASSKTTDYSTNLFYVGLHHNPSKSLSLGLVFYFPSKLKNDNESNNYNEMEVEYSGSLRLGLGYHINDNWTLGLGYGYQWLEEYESGMSTLSAGIGYTFVWDKKSLPIYLMYETILFPQKLNESISDHGENILKYHQVGVGGGIQFTDFSIYAASTWSLYGDYFYSSSLVSPLPPWS